MLRDKFLASTISILKISKMVIMSSDAEAYHHMSMHISLQSRFSDDSSSLIPPLLDLLIFFWSRSSPAAKNHSSSQARGQTPTETETETETATALARSLPLPRSISFRPELPLTPFHFRIGAAVWERGFVTSSAWLLRPPREKATKGLGKTAHTAETVMKRKERRKEAEEKKKKGRKCRNGTGNE